MSSTKRRASTTAFELVARICAIAAGVGLFHLIAGLTWRSDLGEARGGLILLAAFLGVAVFAYWIADLTERAR